MVLRRIEFGFLLGNGSKLLCLWTEEAIWTAKTSARQFISCTHDINNCNVRKLPVFNFILILTACVGRVSITRWCGKKKCFNTGHGKFIHPRSVSCTWFPEVPANWIGILLFWSILDSFVGIFYLVPLPSHCLTFNKFHLNYCFESFFYAKQLN